MRDRQKERELYFDVEALRFTLLKKTTEIHFDNDEIKFNIILQKFVVKHS